MAGMNILRAPLSLGLSVAALAFLGGCADDEREGDYKSLGQNYSTALERTENYCELPRTPSERKLASVAIGNYADQRAYVVDNQGLYSDEEREQFDKSFPPASDVTERLKCE